MNWNRRVLILLWVALLTLLVAGSATGATDSDASSQAASDYTLHLGGLSFDPLVNRPQLPAGWGAVEGSSGDLHLVQLVGPTQDAWLESLEAAGLKIVQYIHPYTYVVWGQNVAAAVEGQAFVRWSGAFAPAYRVLPHYRTLPTAGLRVNVLLYRGADLDNTIGNLEALGATRVERAVLNRTWEVAGMVISGAKLRQAAAVPGVYSIQPLRTDGGLRTEMSDQVNVNNVDANNLAFPGYRDWLDEVGVDGAGVIIANVDGGVQNNHPDLINRLIPCTGSTCGGNVTDGHGTHTAGIMAADGSSGQLDQFGFLRGLGVAPGANLVEQLYSPTFGQAGGMLKLMRESYNNGASLSGNSWGPAGTPQGYDNDTMQVDIGVRDTDSLTAGDQPLSYILSFMNGYGGNSSQGTPDEAKNIFTIGSTKMQNSNGSQILAINDLSSNTAHGPALDGRKIPHMVAPGCDVDSTYSGSGWSLLCGTSMASPHVSGAVAVFIEYYRNLFAVDPSAALIKAAFLPVAHDLAGNDDADGNPLGHPFDSKQGWGRMDLEAVVDPQVSVRYFDNPVVFDNTGEEWVQTLSSADPGQPMKLMLVWTDAPGHGLGGSTPAWNNDLNLVVETSSGTYYGNVFGADGWSQTGGQQDNRNNTEGVFLGPAFSGAATIRVVAANINSDALPNEGDTTDQDFALVCTNCALEPDFTLDATPPSLDICTPANAVYSAAIGSILGYDEVVNLSATGNPAGTTANFSPANVTPPGSSTLTIGNTAAAAPGAYSIIISGTSIDKSHQDTVTLNVATAAPSQPALVSPPNGATDQSLTPTFEWNASAQATSYDLQVATDPQFSNVVYSVNTTDTTHTMDTALEPETTYYWRVRGRNACGAGQFAAAFSFTTRAIPPILLVDDDDNAPDVRFAYTTALNSMLLSYDVWDTANSDDEPDAVTLAPYKIVIWFTGVEFDGFAGPGAAGETALGSWLDSGSKCLFLSSQDYYYDRGLTTFMQTYLGLAAAQSDVSQTQVQGRALFNGLGPYTLNYPFTNYSDRLNPDATARPAFLGDQGRAAIAKRNPTYATTFLGFPWEAIPTPADRQAVLGRITDVCQ